MMHPRAVTPFSPLAVISAGLVLGLLVVPRAALAQDASAAAALFEQGLAEMQAGHYETGCPALAESQRLDPRPGVVFTLAECEARWGRIASAVAHYDDYLRAFHALPPDKQQAQKPRAVIAGQQRAALAGDVPSLQLQLPAGAPEGTRVLRDGVPLGAGALGRALPIDPGEHRIVTEAPGAAPHEERITLALGEHRTLTVTLPARRAEASSEQRVATGASRAAPAEPPAESRATWASLAGGVGIAGLVVGGVTGGIAIANKSTIEDHCVDLVCDAEGKEAADRTQAMGWASTIGFGVGLVGVGVGVVLLLLEPSATVTSRAVPMRMRPVAGGGPSDGFLGLEGAF